MTKLVRKIDDVAQHRNGISGTPFGVVLFKQSDGQQMVGIAFDDEPGCCAAFNLTQLAEGNISFGENSWRGDEFEKDIRAAIKEANIA